MNEFTVQSGWKPGSLGFIIGEHGRYYAREWDFGSFFEAKVASELSRFVARFDRDKDRIFLAIAPDGALLGSLILDLTDPDPLRPGAHLRWFILCDAARGTGAGKALMREALAHCDHLQIPCWLTTFDGLLAARALYDSFGFILTHEQPAANWGVSVLEQLFERARISS